MIDSVGIDIVEVKRVKTLMDKWGDHFLLPSPHGDCVIIWFFVAADFSLRKPFVEFQQLTSIWTATKSKHDCDTPSRGRGIG